MGPRKLIRSFLSAGCATSRPIEDVFLKEKREGQLERIGRISTRFLPEGYAFKPWKMCERPIEEHFSALRRQFISSQMSVRDFIAASGVVSSRTIQQQKKQNDQKNQTTEKDEKDEKDDKDGKEKHEKRLTDVQFQQAAARAMRGAMDLMELCSGTPKSQLHKAYMAFSACRQWNPDVGAAWQNLYILYIYIIYIIYFKMHFISNIWGTI